MSCEASLVELVIKNGCDQALYGHCPHSKDACPVEGMGNSRAQPVCSVTSPYETSRSLPCPVIIRVIIIPPAADGDKDRQPQPDPVQKRLPLAQRPVPTEHLQDSQQRRNHVQDPGLCLERNGVMAETTAFVLLGVKTSAVLAPPLRQNQV
ncbi:mCG55576, isoform CRA_b [Mus musculus]|nr:mCG55576, isoform CRA_b [Mus musculus]